MTTSAPPSAPHAELPQFLRQPAAGGRQGAGAAPGRSWSGGLRRIRLLPVLIAAAMLLLGLKAVSIAAGAADLLSGTEEQAAATPASGPALANTENPPADEAERAAAEAQEIVTAALNDGAASRAVAPDFMSRSELELLQDLAARRKQLEGRAEELDTRERLLLATEQRIDDKIARLKSIEGQIKDLLQIQSEQEEEQLVGLVKVYERMKPEEAAAILEKLDMEIMLKVVQRMNKRKLALVLAEMNPETAKLLTVELATGKQLPRIEG